MINVYLHDDSMIEADITNFNAKEYLDYLNNTQILVITLGDVVLNKNMIKLITPQYSADHTFSNPLKLSLHDGLTVMTEYDQFDSEEMASQLNNAQSSMVAIGDCVVSKNSVRMITPIYPE